jgi:hypothetical protein
VAGLAALRGRVNRAASSLERSASVRIATGPGGERPDLPDPVKAAGLRLLNYAAFGGPADSLRQAAARAHSAIDAYVSAPNREAATAAIFARPVALAWPALDTMSIPGDYLLDIQRAHRATGPRRGPASPAAMRLGLCGDLAIDAALAEVRAPLSTATPRPQENGWSGSSTRFPGVRAPGEVTQRRRWFSMEARAEPANARDSTGGRTMGIGGRDALERKRS